MDSNCPHRADLVCRKAHAQEVVNPRHRIDPDAGFKRHASVEGAHHVFNDLVVGEQALLVGFGSVDVQVNLRSVKALLNPGVHGSPNAFELLQEVLRHFVGTPALSAINLNIDRGPSTPRSGPNLRARPVECPFLPGERAAGFAASRGLRSLAKVFFLSSVSSMIINAS